MDLSDVKIEIVLVTVILRTIATLKRPLTSMHPGVYFQVGRTREQLSTYSTIVHSWIFFFLFWCCDGSLKIWLELAFHHVLTMDPFHMTRASFLSLERFLAKVTFEWSLICVHHLVSLQLRGGRKDFVTNVALVFASIRFRMDRFHIT